jgi:hypothetical protein
MPVQAVQRYKSALALVAEGFQAYRYPYHCFRVVGHSSKKRDVGYRASKKVF